MVDRSEINGNNSRKHGYSGIPTYELCRSLKRRPETVLAEAWRPGRDAALFYEWVRDNLGPRPTRRHILVELIDGYGYIPGNIGWSEPSTVDDRPLPRFDVRERRGRFGRQDCLCPEEVARECSCDYGLLLAFKEKDE